MPAAGGPAGAGGAPAKVSLGSATVEELDASGRHRSHPRRANRGAPDAERRVRLARRSGRGGRDRREAPRRRCERRFSPEQAVVIARPPMARGDGRRGARPCAGRVAELRPCRRPPPWPRGALASLGAPRLGALAAVLLALGAAGGHLRLSALDAPAGRIRDGARVALRGGARHAAEAGPVRIVRRGRRDPHGAPPRHAAADPRARLGPVPARRCAPARSWRSPGGWARSRRRARSDFDDYLRRRGVAGELALERARATGRRRGGAGGACSTACAVRAERAVGAGLPRRPTRRCCAGWCSARTRPSTRSRARTSARAGWLTCWRSPART